MLPVLTSLHIIYASTSGHTEYVVHMLESMMKPLHITKTRAESAKPEDLLLGEVLVLASGTWNTGGREGQMNPHMHTFLLERAVGVELKGKPCSLIALGDDRYYYTARAGEHLRSFIESHGGTLFLDPLTIINEPYDQETKIKSWAKNFLNECSQFQIL